MNYMGLLSYIKHFSSALDYIWAEGNLRQKNYQKIAEKIFAPQMAV